MPARHQPPGRLQKSSPISTRCHYNQLVRLALLLVHDLQTAEEVVQDAFEAMHQAWRRLRDSEKALSYLSRPS